MESKGRKEGLKSNKKIQRLSRQSEHRKETLKIVIGVWKLSRQPENGKDRKAINKIN
jgi:hypothetical protein